MIDETARIVVLAFGVVIAVLSVWGLFVPQKLLDFVKGAVGQRAGFEAAVVVRLVLGVFLILAAPASRFPLVLQVLGFLMLIAAVGLVFMGRERMVRFVAWFDRFSPTLIRLWLVLGVAFGVLLGYAVT